MVVEELGPMTQRYASRGYEVVASIIGWSYECDDCGVVVSTHGTIKKEESSGRTADEEGTLPDVRR